MKRVFFWGVCFLILTGLGGYHVLSTYANQPIQITEPPLYVVQSGATLRQVANDLQQQGVIDHSRLFIVLGKVLRLDTALQVGEHPLNTDMRVIDLLKQLTSGQVVQYSLTLIDGWNFRQMREALDNHPHLTHLLAGSDQEAVMARLGFPGDHPEGRFYPDTYHFPQGMTDVAFLQRAYRLMQTTLQQAWEKRDPRLPYQSPYEALIMASIVEKETAQVSERPRIAGVMMRRLQKKMKLQTDPTVIYALGESFDGNIRRRDLRYDSPYNTYVYKGLPPTPIAMPGKAAIHAVLHPLWQDDTLYFVAKGNGWHHFSATLGEHNQAVRRYQLKQ
jgi:UPF0755 protein